MSGKVRKRRLGDFVKIRTGKLDANANDPTGAYPFFTCSITNLRINSYSYDCECVLVAGNGDLNVKYYDGKFDAYQRTYIIESLDKSLLNVRYLYHFMARYVEKLRRMSIGGVIKYIKLGYLADAQIPLPPLEEQSHIAAVLDKADALRNKRRQAIEKFETLMQAVFLDMFGDPVTNPKGWQLGVLGDVIHSAKDGPHVSPRYSDSGVPFLSTRHIRPGQILWEDLKFISEEDAEMHWKKCKPERGDVLYTKGGTTGLAKAIDFDGEIAVWVHIAVLKTNHDLVDPRWLEEMLNSSYCYAQAQEFTRGIANRDLGLTRMVKIKIYIPPLDLQRKFANYAAKLKGPENKQLGALLKLENLFNSLQERAFTGRLFSGNCLENERNKSEPRKVEETTTVA